MRNWRMLRQMLMLYYIHIKYCTTFLGNTINNICLCSFRMGLMQHYKHAKKEINRRSTYLVCLKAVQEFNSMEVLAIFSIDKNIVGEL